MKKMLVSTVLFLAVAVCLYAAGTATVTYTPSVGDNTVLSYLEFSWTSDATLYNVPLTEISTAISDAIMGKYVIAAITDPGDGADAPTDNYDVALKELAAHASTQGVDVMGGNLADRDTANTEQYLLAVPRPILGPLALTVTSAGAANTGKLTVIISRAR